MRNIPPPMLPPPPRVNTYVCKKGHVLKSSIGWDLIWFFHPCEECGGEMRPEGASFDTRFPVSYDIFNSTKTVAGAKKP